MLSLSSPNAIASCQYIGRRVSSYSCHCRHQISTPENNYLVGNDLFKHRDKCFLGNFLPLSRLRCHTKCILKLRATNRFQHLQVYASSSDKCHSSQSIAAKLYIHYRNFVDRGGTDNLKEFIGVGVDAYSSGCTDEGLRKELLSMKDSGIEIESERCYGGKTGLKYRIYSNEVQECILWLSIIFITILCTPQPTVIRWSPIPPVSDETVGKWKGFCALIANAYYVKGMAWLPVKILQLEQMVVMGHAEEPSLVSSRMQLVFSTLEVVSPQWPRV